MPTLWIDLSILRRYAVVVLGALLVLVSSHRAFAGEIHDAARNGNTALHMAATNGCREIAEVLVANGADVNAKGNAGPLNPLPAGDEWSAFVAQSHAWSKSDVQFGQSAYPILGVLQNPAAPPPATGNPIDIEAMIRARVLAYFGEKSASPESLGIAKVNGVSFGELRFMMIPRGTARYENGRPVENTPVTVVFGVALRGSQQPKEAFSVDAIADDKGGVKTIEKLEVQDGTRVQLKDGDTYTYVSRRWNKD